MYGELLGFKNIVDYTSVHNCSIKTLNHISGIMVCVLTESAVDRGFEPCSDQTNDYKIGICCFSTKHAALRSRSNDCWLDIRIICQSKATCLPVDYCSVS